MAEANKFVPLAEVSAQIPLVSSPEGLFKRVDIGVNNYDPALFTLQEFEIYFLKDSADYNQYTLPETEETNFMVVETKTEAQLF